jgi:hypothetical protein
MACELMLFDHRDDDTGEWGDCADDAHHAALRRRREAAAGKWSPIVRGQDEGGDRDFLDGQPIHCGTTLELQATEEKDDDYGSYTAYLDRGQAVRYELAWLPKAVLKAIDLYADVAGVSFMARHQPWMRFRWPQKGGR